MTWGDVPDDADRYDMDPRDTAEDEQRDSRDEERCGGTGFLTYWDGGGYVGEFCPGCVDCEAPDEDA